MRARLWLFDSEPWKPHSMSTPHNMSIPHNQEGNSSGPGMRAAFASRYCAPGMPLSGGWHTPLLQRQSRWPSASTLKTVVEDHSSVTKEGLALHLSGTNESEVDAYVERTCGPAHMSDFCSTWDGIELCSVADAMPASPLSPRRQRNYQLVELTCNDTNPGLGTASELGGMCEVKGRRYRLGSQVMAEVDLVQ